MSTPIPFPTHNSAKVQRVAAQLSNEQRSNWIHLIQLIDPEVFNTVSVPHVLSIFRALQAAYHAGQRNQWAQHAKTVL